MPLIFPFMLSCEPVEQSKHGRSFTFRLLDKLAAQGERLQGRFVKVICLVTKGGLGNYCVTPFQPARRASSHQKATPFR